MVSTSNLNLEECMENLMKAVVLATLAILTIMYCSKNIPSDFSTPHRVVHISSGETKIVRGEHNCRRFAARVALALNTDDIKHTCTKI